jgi:tetratricopeptide (TPR) repeat protein
MDILSHTRLPDQGWTQHFDIVQELGDCYAQLGVYEQAQTCYEKAATLEPDSAAPYVGLGVISLQNGKLDDADIAFRVAVRLDPQCSRALTGQAMIAQQKGDMQLAFDLYLRGLEIDSDDLTALLGLFQISCQMKSFGKVIEYLKVYLQSHPDDAPVMFCLATLYVKDCRPKSAHELLTRITELDPDNKDAENLLEDVNHMLAQSENRRN